jgi:hypothetical protein
MSTRDEKAWRFDIISLAIAVMSLAVSGAAGVVGYKAWTRPAPADPTYIPSFGQSDNPETIDGGEGAVGFSSSWTSTRTERFALSQRSLTTTK